MSQKFLCVCQYGHSRSVAAVRVLHQDGMQAVAAGHETAGDTALTVLSSWADVIFLMTPDDRHRIPADQQHKIDTSFDVGPDRWSNPYNTELLDLLTSRWKAWKERVPQVQPERIKWQRLDYYGPFSTTSPAPTETLTVVPTLVPSEISLGPVQGALLLLLLIALLKKLGIIPENFDDVQDAIAQRWPNDPEIAVHMVRDWVRLSRPDQLAQFDALRASLAGGNSVLMVK
jgi:predicted protein tyrosine phosphatase